MTKSKDNPKTLFLFRGLPGSGKTTAASRLVDHHVAADEYFDLFYGGKFDGGKLPQAHLWCRNMTERWMTKGIKRIGVHNTFTRPREMREYFQMASRHGYEVVTMIVENRHDGVSVHDVPQDTIQRMRDRFDVEL